MEDDLREFLAVEELSRYLGIKKSNLYSKVERKEIPHYRVGRLIKHFLKPKRSKILESHGSDQGFPKFELHYGYTSCKSKTKSRH